MLRPFKRLKRFVQGCQSGQCRPGGAIPARLSPQRAPTRARLHACTAPPANCPSACPRQRAAHPLTPYRLFCASQGWSVQQSKVNSLCKPAHPVSSSQFVKVRAAWSHRAPLRCLPMCLCVLCPPPCRHALLPLLLVWRASPCGHAAHARVRARLVCLPPAASPPVPCFIPARGG